MTRRNIIGQYVYIAARIRRRIPAMRGGDIFMGAFNAEQVMYNHFGYRTPVGRLYMAGLSRAPGRRDLRRLGYISAGIMRARSRAEAVVAAVGRSRGAGQGPCRGGVAGITRGRLTGGTRCGGLARSLQCRRMAQSK